MFGRLRAAARTAYRGKHSHRTPAFGPRTCMPLFLDTHFGSELPLDEVRDFLRAARSATPDSFGVRALEVYCGDDDGLFYLVAAPDESSVRQRHAAYGLVCQRVRRVESNRAAMDELGAEEKALVQHMIAMEHNWPAQAAS